MDAVGVVTERGEELEAVLITRHLDYSLPFRTLFARGSVPDLRRRLLDAGAELLVRLHLGGFFWGDCSLSNTLFRRDAGALAAYLVDAETGELHPSLSDGQRLPRPVDRRGERRRRARGRRGRARPRGRAAPGGDGLRPGRALRVALGRADARGGVRRRHALQDRRPAAPAERARLRRRGARARRRRRRRLPAAAEPARRRAGPPPPAPTRADRPDGAGEPGAAAAERPRALPGRARPRGQAAPFPRRWPCTAGSRRCSSRRSPRSPPSSGASATRPRSSTRRSSTAGSSPSRRARTSA